MKFIFFAVAASVFAASVIASQVRVKGIEITKPDENYQSSLQNIHGLRSCGGHGRLIEWRVEGCTSDKLCRVPSEGPGIKSELEFIPSQDSEALAVRFIVIEDGGTAVGYERPISNSAVQGGERYISNLQGKADKSLKGKVATAQYILYRVSDNNVEVCAEADYEVY